jgi:hypothetical protein
MIEGGFEGLLVRVVVVMVDRGVVRLFSHEGWHYWGIVINKRRLNKVTLNKVSTRQHVKHLRRFCSTVAV